MLRDKKKMRNNSPLPPTPPEAIKGSSPSVRPWKGSDKEREGGNDP